LVTSLTAQILAVDKWQVFKLINVIALHDKDCAANLDDVVDFERVQLTNLSFGT